MMKKLPLNSGQCNSQQFLENLLGNNPAEYSCQSWLRLNNREKRKRIVIKGMV